MVEFFAVRPTRQGRLPQLDEEHDGDQQARVRGQDERAQPDAPKK
mgnify:FL=1